MPAVDAVRRLSDELARNPASLAFLGLAELLRGRGEGAAALRIARQGAARHPRRADAHELLARVAAEQGAWEIADEAWARVAELTPASDALRAVAHQGRAFATYRQGRHADAERHLDDAVAAGASESAVAAARARIRASLGDPGGRRLFQSLLEPGDLAALLIMSDGTVAAGEWLAPDGDDASAAVARALAGIGDEAGRATRHLALGSWQRMVVEADGALLGVGPVSGKLAVVAIRPETPLGRLRRLLERATERARTWRAGAAA